VVCCRVLGDGELFGDLAVGQTELRIDGVLRSWCLPEELEEDYPDRHGKVEAVCHPLLWDGQTDP
jgi:hypothetical protein